MDIRLPNGKVIRNVPEGTSRQEVMQKAISAGLARAEDFQMAGGQPVLPSRPIDVAAMQRTVQYPAQDTGLGAFMSGATRGLQQIGQGVLQRGAEAAEFLGFDTQDFQKRLQLAGEIEEQRFSPTAEERPVTSTVGEIAGTIAGFPLAPAGKIPAAAAGGAFGLTQPAETAGDVAQNVIQEAAIGMAGEWAAPFIQKGFNNTQALFSGLYKRLTGADPRPEMFTRTGNLSDEGKRAIEELGITQEEFGRLYAGLDQNLEPVAATRLARAQEAGIPLTTGQATQEFAQQEAEQTLLSGLGREAEGARQFAESQQAAIRGAQEELERGIAPQAGRVERGENVQQTLREMQEQGRQRVSELYKKAGELPGDQVPFDEDALLSTIDEQLLRPVDDKVVNSLEKLLAKYAIIGDKPVKKGRFNQVVDETGKQITFRGEQTPLTLENAEEFRQGLNQIFPADQSGAISNIIKALDNQVDTLVTGLPEGSARAEAFQAARAAAREQKQIFNQKDVIQNLVDFKKNTQTNMIDPDRVMDSLLEGPNSRANLRRVKNVLTKAPNNRTVDAWRSIQAQGVADIFAQSFNPATGDVSGQRLKSAIKRFGGGDMKEGEERLKLLLDDKYKEFKNLVDAVGDATIPVKGTTNPSGTAFKIFNFLTRVGSVGTLGADAVLGLANRARDAASAKRVLRQVEKAEPGRVQQAVQANDALIDDFIRLGLTGTLREEL